MSTRTCHQPPRGFHAIRTGIRATSVIILSALLGLASAAPPAPPPQIQFQRDTQAAQRQAKQTGIPLMAVVSSRSVQTHKALADRRVIDMSRRFWNVLWNPAGSAGAQLAKKHGLTGACNVIFLDGAGELLAKVGPDFTATELLSNMDSVSAKAREVFADKLKEDEKSAGDHKTAIEGYVRLGPGVGDLIPLLTHKTPAVNKAVSAALTAKEPAVCALPLLDAMASPEAEVRAACHPVAVAVTKVAAIPPVDFWQDSPESEREAALDKWRQAVFAKLSPLNKLIIDFALANMGKQVGDGECASLAVEALKAGNGQGIKYSGKTYIWGRELAAGERVLPGDIVQMEDCKFTDGSNAGHHTEIIWKVLGPGKYDTLEQNSGGRRTVGPGKLNVSLLKQGTVTIYRPLLIGQEK